MWAYAHRDPIHGCLADGLDRLAVCARAFAAALPASALLGQAPGGQGSVHGGQGGGAAPLRQGLGRAGAALQAGPR